MNFFENLRSLNWSALLPYIVNLLVAMPCITLHELAHGWVAYKLGDPTAKSRGRLTLNPIKHVDPLGLILMVTLGFEMCIRDRTTDMQIHVERMLKIKDRLNQILSENTGKPIDVIRNDTERDNFMTAEEAREYGLIDKVYYKR